MGMNGVFRIIWMILKWTIFLPIYLCVILVAGILKAISNS